MESQQQHTIKHVSWVRPKYDINNNNEFRVNGFGTDDLSLLSRADSTTGCSKSSSSESFSATNERVASRGSLNGSYSADEQYHQCISLDHRADLFSLNYPVTYSTDYHNQCSLQTNLDLYTFWHKQYYKLMHYNSLPWMTTYNHNLALTPETGLQSTDLNRNQQVPSEYSESKKVLPFSIEAILAKDPSPKNSPVSHTVTDIMESRDLYWCHVCESLCQDAFEANLHRQQHLLKNAVPALKRVIFNTHGHVTRHERLCYMNSIRCGICRKTVVISSFKRHIASHNGFPCRICGKEFYFNSRLQEHFLLHTGERPHTCSICCRTFVKKSSLKQHINYHTDNKDAQCEFCGKRFYRACALRVHIRNHTGNFPYKCELPGCTKAFPQKVQLQMHMDTHRRRGDA